MELSNVLILRCFYFYKDTANNWLGIIELLINCLIEIIIAHKNIVYNTISLDYNFRWKTFHCSSFIIFRNLCILLNYR